LKINNSLDVAKWEKLTCKCNHDDVEQCYPISKCEHCRCQECWDSVPQKDFTVNDDITDEEGKVTKKQTKTIKEITLVRGHDLEDVIGWEF
jgi:hypothetical protein